MRLVDMLSTAAAVASHLGAGEVGASHLLTAIELETGGTSFAALGPGAGAANRTPAEDLKTTAEVQQLVWRWFASLGYEVHAQLDQARLNLLVRELESLPGAARPGEPP